MTLWCVLLSALIVTAHAEEFGTSRWTTRPQPPQPKLQVLPYVVRIIAFDSTGQSFGTGSYVGTYGEYGVILTNWHVIFTEGTEGLVHVHFPSGFSSFGAVIKSDLTWDLALIAISKPPQSIPILPVSQTPSKQGDPLWIVGYGSGSYRIAEGKCVRYLAPENSVNGAEPLYEIMEVSVSARKGDSGGPMLNQRGELAGVLFGSDMIQNTAGSYCERVNRFLMETQTEMAKLPDRPETFFASKEKDGPLHLLQDSRNIVPQNTVSQRSRGNGVSSSSAFEGQSVPRRYVPLEKQVPIKTQPAYQKVPEKQGQQNQRRQFVPGAPLSSRVSSSQMPIRPADPTVQPAVWAETAPKVASQISSANVIQTAHLTPLENLIPLDTLPLVSPINDSVENRYLQKLSSDRNDTFFLLFVVINIIAAVGLTYYAFRLLAKD